MLNLSFGLPDDTVQLCEQISVPFQAAVEESSISSAGYGKLGLSSCAFTLHIGLLQPNMFGNPNISGLKYYAGIEIILSCQLRQHETSHGRYSIEIIYCVSINLFIGTLISTKYKSINHPNHAKLVLYKSTYR